MFDCSTVRLLWCTFFAQIRGLAQVYHCLERHGRFIVRLLHCSIVMGYLLSSDLGFSPGLSLSGETREIYCSIATLLNCYGVPFWLKYGNKPGLLTLPGETREIYCSIATLLNCYGASFLLRPGSENFQLSFYPYLV